MERLGDAGARLRPLARGLVAAATRPVGTIVGVATDEPAVALSFDDGPDPTTTPALLELLERHEARATFFVVGRAAAAHRGLVERIAAAGHALGNHSWDHPSFPLIRPRYRRAQLAWCQEALDPWGERLFRPPYGHQSPGSFLTARRAGYRVVGWEALAEDWRDEPAAALVAQVRRRLRRGSIVTFHDTLYTTVERRYRDRGPTLEAVERLLAELRGWRFVTVPELLRLGRARTWPWFWRPDLDWMRRAT